jgi:hypothetical protein
MVLKPELQKKVPLVKKRFVKYADFAGKQITRCSRKKSCRGPW